MTITGDINNSKGRLLNAETALAYMLAGNATFTLRSVLTGARYTYKVRCACAVCWRCGGEIDTSKQPAYMRWPDAHATCPSAPVSKARNEHFVSLLTGSDNSRDYTYIGMLCNGVFYTTRKSKLSAVSTPLQALAWALRALRMRKDIPRTLEIWHCGRCGRCGRKLTVPESISSGLGPECAAKLE